MFRQPKILEAIGVRARNDFDALPEGVELTHVLEMKPGDILIIKAKDTLSRAARDNLRETAKLFTPPGMKVVVLDSGMELSILRATQILADQASES